MRLAEPFDHMTVDCRVTLGESGVAGWLLTVTRITRHV